MRLATRLLVTSLLITTCLLFALKSQIESRWNQYGVGDYIKHEFKSSFRGATLDYLPPLPGKTGDKIIVMARLQTDDVSWVAEELSDWKAALYTVNPSSSTPSTPDPDHPEVGPSQDPDSLTTPANKGHEAMAYLTYLIDNYARLPSIMAFIHSHKSGFLTAWHTDTPSHSNVDALRSLRFDYVEKTGYVNLRCKHNPGCLEAHTHNAHVTPYVYRDLFSGTSTALNASATPPQRVGAACCAQFAVSREQVLQRPKSDYERFRQWILDTEESDATSGRVMEFAWHIIFGREAVHCPDERDCYCNVYGRC